MVVAIELASSPMPNHAFLHCVLPNQAFYYCMFANQAFFIASSPMPNQKHFFIACCPTKLSTIACLPTKLSLLLFHPCPTKSISSLRAEVVRWHAINQTVQDTNFDRFTSFLESAPGYCMSYRILLWKCRSSDHHFRSPHMVSAWVLTWV